jgi:serine protease Do
MLHPALPRRAALVGALALTAALPLLGGAQARAEGPRSFAPLIKRILPAVVNIGVEETVRSRDPLADLPPAIRKKFHDRLPPADQHMAGAGSGFIIDPSGLIVTNNHVVGTADRIVVGLSDGRSFPARLVGSDELTDVALIKIDAPDTLPAVTFGSSHALQVGDWVIAAGNPFGLGGSVTAGIVSAFGRDLGAGPFDDFIQIDAPINPGNSGGPLFDSEGRVVGMNSAIYTPSGGSVGIGFAIPSELIQQIVAQLKAHGTIQRGWLGVTLDDGSDGGPFSRGSAAGVRIVEVTPRGPAARAGLRAGDTVVAVNGEKLGSSRTLQRAIALTEPGTRIQMDCVRHGRAFNLSVEVGLRPRLESN